MWCFKERYIWPSKNNGRVFNVLGILTPKVENGPLEETLWQLSALKRKNSAIPSCTF